MKKIIKFFIDNPLIVNVITVFKILSGILSYSTIQREGYPQVDEPGCSISAAYPGASPEDIELNIAIPIENALEGVDGIKRYQTNCYENYCNVHIEFYPNINDIDSVRSKIQRNIDKINNFPPDMKTRPQIHEWGAKHMDLVRIGIMGKDISRREMQRRVKVLKERLLENPNISKIDDYGIRQREIQIKINLDKMNSYLISFNDVISAIQSHNIHVTSGTLKSYTSEKNIITISKFDNLMQVKNIILRSNLSGNRILLSDIADITDSFEEAQDIIRFDGEQGIALFIFKKAESDILKSVESVKTIISEYETELNDSNFSIKILMDNSESTKSRLAIVKNNALSGLLLVAIILFIFLSFKNAVWTVLGIPFSICFGLIFIPGFGITINSVSLLGIIIVLGMIVDDAIVISENIYRHKILGENTGSDSAGATTEVGFAVLTTILTTLIAFIPLYFMKGVIGAYIKEIPIIISLLLLGSLFESLLILPAHTSHNLKSFYKFLIGFITGAAIAFLSCRHFEVEGVLCFLLTAFSGIIFSIIFILFYKEDVDLKEKRYMSVLKKAYTFYLKYSLKLRYLTLIIFFIILAVAGFTATKMKFEMFPSVEANIVLVNMDTKNNKSLEYTADISKEIENFIINKYDKNTLRSLVTLVGTGGHPEHLNFQIFLTPESKRNIKSDTIIDDIRKFIEDTDKFEDLNFGKADGGPNLSNSVELQISGNNDDLRKEVTELIYNDLISMNGSEEILRSDKKTKEEIKIVPKDSMISAHNISAHEIAQITGIAYSGYVATEVQTPEEKIPYRIVLDEKYRRKVSTLNKLMIRSKTNNFIPVSRLVSIKSGKAESEIKRFNGYRTTEINASFDSGVIKAGELYTLLKEKYSDINKKYPGIRLNIGGAAELSNDALGNLYSTLFISIAGIFMLLIFLFRSVTQPLIVLLAIPFGLIGVIAAFAFRGMPLSFMGMMGAIGLSGVVVNDSLIMVEYINQLRKRDSEKKRKLKDIITEGATTRLRPILLTTITTFGGLFPTTIGLGGSDPMVLPAATALSWGLVFSTLLVIFILPSFYYIEHDIRELFGKKIPSFIKRFINR